MAHRNAASQSLSLREVFAEMFVGRLMMLGAAGFGFMMTFLLLGRQVASLKNVLLPLLAFLPAYLFLIALNMGWSARTMAKMGLPPRASGKVDKASSRRFRILKTLLSLVFGVVAALIYVHAVTN